MHLTRSGVDGVLIDVLVREDAGGGGIVMAMKDAAFLMGLASRATAVTLRR